MKSTCIIKRISKILLFIILMQQIITLAPLSQVFAAGITAVDDNGITWEYIIDEEGKATLVEYKSGVQGNTLIVPRQIDGYAVIGINGTYNESTGRNSIIKENELKEDIITIKLPDSLEIIDDKAFYGFTKLEEIEYYNINNEKATSNIKYIGKSAFQNCKTLAYIELSKKLTDIKGSAFMGCEKLNNIELPEALTYIDGLVFYGCESLEEIKIHESIT